MVSRILFDTNVIIDVLAERKPFVDTSQAVWQAHVDGIIVGYVAAVSLTNLFYIITRLDSRARAWRAVRVCLETFTVCEVNREILKHATTLPGEDFEDNVQISSAYAYQLDSIITRDKSGFKEATIPALMPEELLAQLDLNGD